MKKADSQRPDLPLQRATRKINGAISRRERLSRLGQKDHSLRRKSSRSLAAIDQCTAYFVLQISDLFADGRLRDVQAATGLAKSSVVSYGGKVS